jgi:hypothetical protein
MLGLEIHVHEIIIEEQNRLLTMEPLCHTTWPLRLITPEKNVTENILILLCSDNI